MKRTLILAALVAGAAVTALAQVTDQTLLKPDSQDWVMYSGTYMSQRYSALDGQRALRVAAGLDSGFAAYPAIDPVIIADITANGAISVRLPRSVHAALLAEAKAEGVSVNQLCAAKLVAQLRAVV